MPEIDVQARFQRGLVFRRTDLHAEFGGQRQGGIVTPKNYPLIFAISGKAGHQHGYHDHWTADGAFQYYGEGQSGDMRFMAGNKAIRDHQQLRKHLILFEQVESKKTHLRCLGEFICTNHHVEQGQDRFGHNRKAIVFHLQPKEEVRTLDQVKGSLDTAVSNSQQKPLEDLESRAFGGSAAQQTTVTTTVRNRNPDVIAYVLGRADGICEGCEAPAPFNRSSGGPYLEVHHVVPLADDGPDSADNAVALCPNCHRRSHYSADKVAFTRSLRNRLLRQVNPLQTTN